MITFPKIFEQKSTISGCHHCWLDQLLEHLPFCLSRHWVIILNFKRILNLEVIRTKMQSEILSFKDLKKSVHVSIKQDGVFSLWRGLNATFLRDIPFSGNCKFVKIAIFRHLLDIIRVFKNKYFIIDRKNKS